MNKTYLLLGSNIGDSMKHLAHSKKLIQKNIGKIKRASSVYSTSAWGNENQNDFLNQVLVIDTTMNSSEAMKAILDIEQQMGRIRTRKNAPRIIDIDILFFNKEIIQSKALSLPHPLIQERKFVLTPLNELSPSFIHPVFNKTIHQLLIKCKDTLMVKKK